MYEQLPCHSSGKLQKWYSFSSHSYSLLSICQDVGVVLGRKNELCNAKISTVTFANPCDFNSALITQYTLDNDNYKNLVFQNEQDLREKLADCTTLADDMVILANFTGTRLDLTGLRETARIYIRTTAITEFLIDDLERAESIEYESETGAAVETFSAPELASVGRLSIGSPVTNMSLPILVEARALYVPKRVGR